MVRKFKQYEWWSTIPSISTNQTITSSKHKNVVGLNQLMGSHDQPSPLDNWISWSNDQPSPLDNWISW
jgi:hypothetical protein